MVSTRWGGVAAQAAAIVSSHVSGRVATADKATYLSRAKSAIDTLQSWYNPGEGLWNTAGWWNGANCLTVLADYAIATPKGTRNQDLVNIMSQTFYNAQTTPVRVSKTMAKDGLINSTTVVLSHTARDSSIAQGYPGFLNDYYDDEGWWALAILRVHDYIAEPSLMDPIQNIFEDMKRGLDTNTCGGGLWWNKANKIKNAIPNELFFTLAANLANRVADKKQYYTDIAMNHWTWFRKSGMLNDKNTINDGLTIHADRTCSNDNGIVWSYNQGVILGGLVELSKATGDTSYLISAQRIADAAIDQLQDSDGILHDKMCEPDCGADGTQFKGIFMRYLALLQETRPSDKYKTFILRNADHIWDYNRDTSNNQLGGYWPGPVGRGGTPSATSQSSALDCLIAAARVVT
jgi:predicted alpha-1,6-mannanase (GH76 family)